MAIIKPNQPVVFNATEDVCSLDAEYIQIVDNTDKTQFQLGLTICNGASELNPDPNFADPLEYTLGAGWSVSANTLCRSSASGISTAATVNLGTALNDYCKISISVDSISSGAIFPVYLGTTLVGSITSTGEYTFYGFVTTLNRLSISNITTGATICISSMSVYKLLTNFIVPIYDSEDVYVDEISYTSNPEYFVFADDSVTVTIDWGALGITNGCYYLCLLDPCSNTGGQNYPADITNGTFTGSATGWTLGSAWTYSANAVVGSHSGTVINNWLTQSNVFINYTTVYSITVEITTHTGSLTVYFGDNLVATLTTTGSHVVTGVASGNLDLKLYMLTNGCTITAITANAVTSDNYVCNSTSNSFNLGDYSELCPRTLLINACNDENGLGFTFVGSGFTPRLRLQGKLKNPLYNSERNLEEDSLGTKRIIYYNRRKSKKLVADLLPEYIHDFLSTLIGYDRFYVDGTAYIVDDDEYNVTYDDSQDNAGSVSLSISEQTQLIRNVNCSSDENSCSIDGNFLLQADDNSQYITLVNGEEIEING